MEKTREEIRARMREIHGVLVKHDKACGPLDGCQCVFLRKEMNDLWQMLNPNPRTHGARAGPYPGQAGGREDPMGDVANEGWAYLRQTEHDE